MLHHCVWTGLNNNYSKLNQIHAEQVHGQEDKELCGLVEWYIC